MASNIEEERQTHGLKQPDVAEDHQILVVVEIVSCIIMNDHDILGSDHLTRILRRFRSVSGIFIPGSGL